MSKITIVTVVDSVAATSMPINEFVFYRNREKFGFKEILMVCDKSIPDNVQIPEGITIHLAGSDKKTIRQITKSILSEAKQETNECVFHMHAQKSAMIFLLATIGLGIRKRTLFTIHSTFSSRDLKYKLSSCICTLLSNYANCVSYSAYKEYAGWVRKVKGNKFIAIPNGVDVSRIKEVTKDLPSHQAVAERKNLVCVGRIIPIKNQEFLVRLLPMLPDSRLTLIGAEDNEQRIRRLAIELQVIDRVEFKGLVPRDEVFRLLNASGLYVSSSTVEGLPVSVLEAMCLGLVPVLSDIEPHKEIADRCSIFKVLPLDTEKWIQNISGYQEMDLVVFNNLSNRIRTSVAENYSLDNMHCEYIKIYNKIKG